MDDSELSVIELEILTLSIVGPISKWMGNSSYLELFVEWFHQPNDDPLHLSIVAT